MTSLHNRRGSVLLMAIGMLTILAILASTFLVLSNLDSEETESLAVRAYADPIVDGLLAKAIAAISFDRQATADGPYRAMLANADGLVSFTDYPRPYTNAETSDHWLATSFLAGQPGEGISGQLTNLDGPANSGACAGKTFGETTTLDTDYPKGQKGDYVDTDCDGIPDAYLAPTGISSPLSDANSYYYGARIVDLSSRICINTAGGWDSGDSLYDRPAGSGPDLIDMRQLFDKRRGSPTTPAIYPLLNAGDASGVKGRVGDAAPAAGGTANNPAPASTKGYYRYCGAYLIAPSKPTGGTGGYQPFGIGDEVFFLNACPYLDNTSQFGGRINQIISPLCNTTNTPLPDHVRRQLTTISCVSSLVRWPNAAAGFTQPLVIGAAWTEADRQSIYHRMKLMLEATGLGKTADDKTSMAAHFAANLWAYCANSGIGEPWKFTPDDSPNLTVYGVRQDLVITQVFARHIVNTAFNPITPDPAKDNSAWGCAIEVSNPTESALALSNYEFEIKSADGTSAIVPLSADSSTIAATSTSTTTTAPTKRVIYNCGFGEARGTTVTPDMLLGLFGETPTASWYQYSTGGKLDFRKGVGATSITITLYRKVGSERVPIDVVTVGNAASFDLPYDTKIQPTDITGNYDAKTPPTRTDNPVVFIRRDDRMRSASGAAGTRLARFNLAMYKLDGPTENAANLLVGTTKLGLVNGIVQPTELTRNCNGRNPATATYSPGIYRPRNVTVSGMPSARESMLKDDYYLPSLADMDNIYLTGPERQGTAERPFTIGILQTTRSVLFTDRADCGRMPTVDKAAPDVAAPPCPQAAGKYPDIPQGFLFHEFFARLAGHQARSNETKRIYGMVNINTLAIPKSVTYDSAAWRLPLPQPIPLGTIASNTGNRMALGGGGAAYSQANAIAAIGKYRDASGKGFLTPGEVGIPLAKYTEETLFGAPSGGAVPDAKLQDADYVRARNCLFGYISDCISTRSDVFACYITVQYGHNASGKRWRYVAVIDRSNVMGPNDKAALLLLSQLR